MSQEEIDFDNQFDESYTMVKSVNDTDPPEELDDPIDQFYDDIGFSDNKASTRVDEDDDLSKQEIDEFDLLDSDFEASIAWNIKILPPNLGW